MNYNIKEEADREREAAVKKFIANDFAGAKKCALQAQSLNPELDGITQMVATFAIHSSAQHIINGVVDYYGVLGVRPEVDDETVKKRYKKLAVMLHPDRNKSIGAEGAFQFVSEAWGVLSDKEKRAEYDSKRGFGLYEGKGVQKAAKGTAKGKSSKRGMKGGSDPSASSSSAPPPPPPPPPAATTSGGTFWTVCSSCETRYEHHRFYLKQHLLCRHCGNLFLAVETAPPHSDSIHKTILEHQFDSIDWDAVYTATINATHGSRKDEAMRRESTKRAAAATPSTTNPPRRRKVVAVGSNVASSSSAPKSKPTMVTNLHELFTPGPVTEDVNIANAGSSQNTSAIDSVENLASLTIHVPDSDFYDFNKNRTETSFSDDQIWASYDRIEGMPRVYFMIDKVLSVDPFKVCITNLTTPESVARTCGGFIPGESQICKTRYIFSHKMEVVKGNHGEFLIYPRTGDVWALYKNWAHDWNYPAGGKGVVEYDVVEVVEGYREEYGVTVVPLMKVAGFRSVFRHYLGPEQMRSISKDELARFSHQIPSYLLTGREAGVELRGCRELDPAATPSQLLKVVDG